MSISAYRIKSSITAVILRGASERFQCLNGGSILIPMSGPDAAGMIEAKYEGDRVLVFRNGRVVEAGETERIFESPRHSYTRELMAASPSLRRMKRLSAPARATEPATG